MSLAPSRGLLRAAEPPSPVSISSLFFLRPPPFTTRRRCSSSSAAATSKASEAQAQLRRRRNPNPVVPHSQLDRARHVVPEAEALDFDGLQSFYELGPAADGTRRSRGAAPSPNAERGSVVKGGFDGTRRSQGAARSSNTESDSVVKGGFDDDLPVSINYHQPWNNSRARNVASSVVEIEEGEDERRSWTAKENGNVHWKQEYKRKEGYKPIWQDSEGKFGMQGDPGRHQWEQAERRTRKTEDDPPPSPPPWIDGYGDIDRGKSSSFEAERKLHAFVSGSPSPPRTPGRAFRNDNGIGEGNSSFNNVNLRDGREAEKKEAPWMQPGAISGLNSDAAYSNTGGGLRNGYDKTKEGSERSDFIPKPDSAITQIIDKLRNMKGRNAEHEVVNEDPKGHIIESIHLPKAANYMKDIDTVQIDAAGSERDTLSTRLPWEIEQDTESTDARQGRAVRNLTLAELTIPEPELRRLRILSLHLKQRVKIGRNGVSKDLVRSIHERWRTCEIVKLKCEGPAAGNMKKTLETLEQKTGGLVIWKAGTVAVLYRGQNFGQPVAEIVDDLLAKKMERISAANREQAWPDLDATYAEDAALSNELAEPKPKKLRPELQNIDEYINEMNEILEELGPRYEEWAGSQPVPVDGDLLPRIIPNYTPPFRVLPFGVRAGLNNTVATHLRRISRPLPPHIVIGRDRDLHGVAAAMVKLWEKSEIAKIGFKRGILNTNQERISEDLKQLTGGFLLCRDKYSATFFRGKDFLPQEIASALSERDAMSQALTEEEERARADRSIMVQQSTEKHDGRPSWVHLMDPEEQIRLRKEAARVRRMQIVNYLERKIQMALQKREKAGKELEKVEELLKPVDAPADKEMITEEERFMFKKLGLRMRAFLLVGRRGVFSGVVQNMHLHWKHRELVKIIIKERDPVQLKMTAKMLANESGGILVAVEKTSKGYAIIVYRGKNYARPPQLRPPNLLTKRLALKRHIEMQKRASLAKHIRSLEEEIIYLRTGLSKMNNERVANGEIEPVAECSTSEEDQKNLALTSDQSSSIVDMEDSDVNTAEQSKTEASSLSDNDNEDFPVEDENILPLKISKRKLRRLSEMGPVFRAERLSLAERHMFRNEVESMSKAAQFLVGRSNPLSKIAAAIRTYFLDHAFVKIGMRGRPAGTSVQDIAEELEDLTGGTVYAQDVIKIIMYRGWPSGTKMPTSDIFNVLSPGQCDVLEEEDDEEEDDWSGSDENDEGIDIEFRTEARSYEDESWGILADGEEQSDVEEPSDGEEFDDDVEEASDDDVEEQSDDHVEDQTDDGEDQADDGEDQNDDGEDQSDDGEQESNEVTDEETASESNDKLPKLSTENWDIFQAQPGDYDIDARIAELDLDEDV